MATICQSPMRERRTRSKKVSRGDNERSYVRPHRCTIDDCSKSFTRAEHLKRHQLNHKPIKTWSCTSCSVTFVRKDLWRRHLRLSHGEQYLPSSEDSQTTYPAGSNMPQDDCGDLSGDSNRNTDSIVTAESNLCNLPSELEPGSLPEAVAVSIDQSMKEGNTPIISGYKGNPNIQQTADLDMMLSPLDMTWIQEMEDWRSGYCNNKGSRFTDTDMDWFFQNQPLPDLEAAQVWYGGDSNPAVDSADVLQAVVINSMAEFDKADGVLPPAYLQDLQTKIYVAKTGDLEAPTCGFRVCNALTNEGRIDLLMKLRNITEIDPRDPIFSLNSMKQGIHLFCRHISIEYPFIHHEILVASSSQSREMMKEVFGDEPGPQLVWAAITLGWTLMRSDDKYESIVASKIQRAIRASIINHPSLTNTPSLWLVQTLFLVLLYSRYQGTREEYGFASVFHGVLLEATRRLDYRLDWKGTQVDGEKDPLASMRVWMKWIETETIRRLILQTFAFDVKHAILYGAETPMTPFDLNNLRLPFSDYAWHATNPTHWAHIMSIRSEEPVPFLPLLKRYWNPQFAKTMPEALPCGGNVIMYGLISIARELSRREDLSLSNRSSDKLLSLGNTVRRSFETWETTWKDIEVQPGLKSFAWRNCTCVIRLAHTLYEIGSIDLQTVAGKKSIEGKRRSAADYAWSRRKLRLWVKHDRAALGLHHAASVIKVHLTGEASGTHCHHCLWCLYLAALVCWNFGFALTKATTDSQDLIKDGQVTRTELAMQECHDYLRSAMNFHRENGQEQTQALTRPTGMLIVLIGLLQSRCEKGMIEESIEHLTRLAGLSMPLASLS